MASPDYRDDFPIARDEYDARLDELRFWCNAQVRILRSAYQQTNNEAMTINPAPTQRDPADVETAEVRVLKALMGDYYRNWKSADLAKATGLNPVTVRKTQAWRTWKNERQKQQRAGRGRRGSKANDGTLEAVGDTDWQSEIDARLDRE